MLYKLHDNKSSKNLLYNFLVSYTVTLVLQCAYFVCRYKLDISFFMKLEK